MIPHLTLDPNITFPISGTILLAGMEYIKDSLLMKTNNPWDHDD